MDEPAYDVGFAVKRCLAAIYLDSSRSGLPFNTDVAGRGYGPVQENAPSHVKDYNVPAGRDAFGKGAGTGVVQICYVIDCPPDVIRAAQGPGTGGRASKTKSAWKRWNCCLCPGRDRKPAKYEGNKRYQTE
jgi:hypothetical protein